jgi:hypothetical protein
MKKKMILVCVLAVLAGALGFAQEEETPKKFASDLTKHRAGDMSINIDFGMNALGVQNIGGIIDGVGSLFGNPNPQAIGALFGLFDKTSTAAKLDLGVGFEYYILNWLNVGVMVNADVGAVLGQSKSNPLELGIGAPVSLSIPVSVNMNIPWKPLEWLYVGVGAEFNITLYDILGGIGILPIDEINAQLALAHSYSSYIPGGFPLYRFAGVASGDVRLFQDIGFDYIHTNRKGRRVGGRFAFRLYEGLAAFSEGAWQKGFGYGFVWTAGNYKLNK